MPSQNPSSSPGAAMSAGARAPSTRHRGRVRALLATALAGAAALVGVTGSAAPASADWDEFHTTWRIGGPDGGWAKEAVGGWFDGLVTLDRSATQPFEASTYRWRRSKEHYTGPGGRQYYTYTSADSVRCLSHDADLVWAEPCVWSDNAQWWSVEHLSLGSGPGGTPITAKLMTSWSAPGKVIATSNDLLVMQPRAGSTGSWAQRLRVELFNPLP